MLWDESFESWMMLGVTSQPAAVLLTPDGEALGGWLGMYPEDEVLELSASYVGG